MSLRERALLACGLIGPPLFVAVFLVVSVAHPPGYSPLRHTVSAYALGDFGWVQTVNFLLAGGLLVAFAFGLRPALQRLRWRPLGAGAGRAAGHRPDRFRSICRRPGRRRRGWS